MADSEKALRLAILHFCTMDPGNEFAAKVSMIVLLRSLNVPEGIIIAWRDGLPDGPKQFEDWLINEYERLRQEGTK
jgi:hypothetical protein